MHILLSQHLSLLPNPPSMIAGTDKLQLMTELASLLAPFLSPWLSAEDALFDGLLPPITTWLNGPDLTTPMFFTDDTLPGLAHIAVERSVAMCREIDIALANVNPGELVEAIVNHIHPGDQWLGLLAVALAELARLAHRQFDATRFTLLRETDFWHRWTEPIGPTVMRELTTEITATFDRLPHATRRSSPHGDNLRCAPVPSDLLQIDAIARSCTRIARYWSTHHEPMDSRFAAVRDFGITVSSIQPAPGIDYLTEQGIAWLCESAHPSDRNELTRELFHALDGTWAQLRLPDLLNPT
jgi:hypothetical protein